MFYSNGNDSKMQRKILNTLALFLLSLSLSACIHKVTIEQGNVITQDMVNQLRTGMTSDQVQFIMGHPVLVETFEANRADYVYTLQTNGGPIGKKRITLLFQDGRLTSINGTLASNLNPTTVAPSLPQSNDAVDPNTHTDTVPAAAAVGQAPAVQ